MSLRSAMTRGVLFFLVGVLSARVAEAQESKVRVSLELPAGGDVYVGQRLTLVVELLAPGTFSGAPAFDLPRVEGVLIVPPAGHPVVGSETVGDVAYTTQRHELSVFARSGGPHVIPPFTVRFGMKRSPLDHDAVQQAVRTTEARFTSKAPPGAEKLGAILCANDLTVDDAWKPEPGKAKEGDAFVRTITFTAPGVPGMAFPPVPTPQIDGVGVYAKEPEVLDTSERGDLTGRRTQAFTYVCQRPGKFEVPPMRLTWWDLDDKQLRTVELKGRSFDVAPNPALAHAAATQPAAESSDAGTSDAFVVFEWIAAISVGLAAASLVVWKTSAWRIAPWTIEQFRPVRLSPLNPEHADL